MWVCGARRRQAKSEEVINVTQKKKKKTDM